MSVGFDPVRTSAEIAGSYRRYLGSLLATRDPRMGTALSHAIAQSPMLHKGPYLEATPPYMTGESASALIREGVLATGFARLDSPALPIDRPLYRHQEQSIRKVSAGRNVVVATGTGSGKTESFLLPILDSLVREHEAGTLSPGVRALFLYPMNALANDQMKRLRAVLAAYPEITFGRYTGDTLDDPRKAGDRFEVLNPGEPRLTNELLSRDEMRRTPPHILLTNYAMLEYLLLRPQDMALFGEGGEQTWRFLVIDEAHVYDGTQGAEIAMLVRRLRERVVGEGELQCIATSATVGSDPEAVIQFASNLFGVPFEWVDHDPRRQDLVLAQRVTSPRGPFWGPLSSAEYVELAASDDPARAVLTLAASHGWQEDDAADAIRMEVRLADLKKALSGGPRPFDALVEEVFPADPRGREALVALVAVASGLTSPGGSPALSARYHLFLRATEGAFSCLTEAGPHVHLARHEKCPDCDGAIFEIGACRRCGAIHLVGSSAPGPSGTRVFAQRRREQPTTWLAVDPAEADDEDETVTGSQVDVNADPARLCSRCATILPAETATCPVPECGATTLPKVARLKEAGNELAGCVSCGARGDGTVRTFETGSDAAGAVLATSLYQALPVSTDPQELMRRGEGRKLLMFSDSRQAAAYFAPYLEDTYGRLQQRRLVFQGLERAHVGAGDGIVRFDDVAHHSRAMASAQRFFDRRDSAQAQERVVAPWIMAESVSVDDRQSLEGLGLVRIILDRDPAWRAPAPLLAFGLSEEEAWDFVGELVRTLRQQGALTMPDAVAPNDAIFAPRLGPIYARSHSPEPKHKVLSWLPGRGTNRRVDYVRKVLAELGTTADPLEVLEGVWRFLTQQSSSVDWLVGSAPKGLGAVHQVDHQALQFEVVNEAAHVYSCAACRRVAPVSVRGICPSMGCGGRLEPFSPPPVTEDHDHFRVIYRSMNPVSLSALEHTAQWSTVRAAEIQQKFIRGEVNALSCSTTFELGVDVGELQSVLLRNVPPTTANYVQRAGRAGRRTGSAALVVTYAQRRSHDLTRYADPVELMAGEVRAPYVPLTNARIDQRHAFSVALSAFFRWWFETTHTIARKAGEFFSGDPAPVDGVRQFLTPSVPEGVQRSLLRSIPPEVHGELGLADGSWVDALLERLDLVRSEFQNDLGVLEAARDQAVTDNRFGQAERLTRVMGTIASRDLLGYLANHNVIPKYGFPVDTVELRTGLGGGAFGADLELSRDLSQAIHEYAPAATLVAGGQLWTSRGLYRLPGKELESFQYHVCQKCSRYWEALDNIDSQCPDCHQPAATAARTFVVPEFGFVADPEPTRPGPRPPERSWSGATHVERLSEAASERTIALPGSDVLASVGPRGRLVAISDGRGARGFLVCDWCGWATPGATGKAPTKHSHLLRQGRECGGPLRRTDLAHRYETDLLSLTFTGLGRHNVTHAHWSSVLYALIEAASSTLQIARDDIDGVVGTLSNSSHSLVLFDTVPGGGGNVLRIAEHLEQVLTAALRRVDNCDCGPETSCYGCLRSYRNQRDHDTLSRGAASDLLRQLGIVQG